MSRCSSTPSVLDVVLDGDDLTARERAHVAGCGDCAREVARARRFDTELRSVGIDLTPVPLPDARDLVDQRAMSNGGSGMHARRIVAG
jgi:anti-sigma factor RsiW